MDVTPDDGPWLCLIYTTDVWHQATSGRPAAYLCPACMTHRLGRPLVGTDLAPEHWVNLTWWDTRLPEELVRLTYDAWVLAVNAPGAALPEAGDCPHDPGIRVTTITPVPPEARWLHVSPYPLQSGVVLTPQRGRRHTLNPGICPWRAEWVWMVPWEDQALELLAIRAMRVYELLPAEPQPWNGTGIEGWVTRSAVVLGEGRSTR